MGSCSVCKKCKHFKNGKGDMCCSLCDPPFEDRFEKKEEIEKGDTVLIKCRVLNPEVDENNITILVECNCCNSILRKKVDVRLSDIVEVIKNDGN